MADSIKGSSMEAIFSKLGNNVGLFTVITWPLVSVTRYSTLGKVEIISIPCSRSSLS